MSGIKANLKIDAAKLLREAEKIQKDRQREGLYDHNVIDALELLQKLQVHQIELEMQNDELQKVSSDFEESKIKYMNLYEFAPVGYFTLDSDSTIREANLSGAMIFGVDRAELIGKRFDLFIEADGQTTFRDMLFRAFKSNIKEISEISLPITLTHKIYLHLEAVCYEGEEECLLTATDITDLKHTESLLRESESKYRLISDNATDVIWVFNLTKEKFSYISPSIFNLMGYTAEEVLNKKIEEVFSVESSPAQIDLIKSRRDQLIKDPQGKNHYLTEAQQPCKNGDLIWVEMTSKYYLNPDGDIEIVGVSRNIEHRKNAEKNMFYLSYHDQLTGLYNRRYYEEELIRLDTERNLPISLVIADVNGLKLVNDAFGHKAGDLILKNISKVLKSECRADEIVARIGGDEFVILLPCTDLSAANNLILRITSAFSKMHSDETIISASFGVALKQTMSQDMNRVFKEAENDMYRHKLSESSSIRSKTVDLIMRSLYEKNDMEMHHSKRVSKLCEAIAVRLEFEPEAVNRLKLAGLMHDIGKIGVSDTILNKTDKLTDDEWHEVMKHSEVGYRILSSVNEFSEIADFVLEHHEKWDGTGYPIGLKGEEISVEARIIGLADVYDAMISKRTYKNHLSKDEAIAEITKLSGSQFDPMISKVFVEYLLTQD